MPLAPDLQKLPSQAHEVIRYLAAQPENGALAGEIIEGAGLTERSFGKAIRRLVTRSCVEMPARGYYVLTALGQQLARELGVAPVDPPGESVADSEPHPVAETGATDPPPVAATGPNTLRRLSVVVPVELVIGAPAVLRVGFDPLRGDQMPPDGTARVIVRLSAPGCDVSPAERPLEVPAGDPVGPVTFRLTPHEEGMIRVRVQVFQVIDDLAIRLAGGMYFDRHVAGFPTPDSAEFQALAADIALIPLGNG